MKIRFHLLLVFLFISICAFAKKPQWQLQVDGKVLTYDASQLRNVPANPCKIVLYCDSVKTKEVDSPANGEFSFELDPDHDYIISATSDGFINQKVLICTKDVPEGRGNRSFATLNLSLVIFKTFPDYNYSFLDKPLVRICYNFSSSVEDFDYDVEYEMTMAKDVNKEQALNEIATRHLMYDDEIKRGDILFNSGKWEDAKSAYLGASANLPLEQYPKDQVAKCDEKLDVIKKAQGAKDNEYSKLLTAGDSLFAGEDFKNAKVNYQEASNIHPELFYPKSRITECDQAIANDPDGSKAYNDLIAAADELFADKDYDGAKFKYKQASGLRPNEKYPKDKIAVCETYLKTQDPIQPKYDAAIKAADDFFNKKDYANAKAKYQEASAIKSKEAYPLSQIKKCDQAINGDPPDKTYNDLIAKADAQFKAGDYAGAKTSYVQASNLKTTEEYPKDQIKLCDQKNQIFEAGYKDTIAAADKLFLAKDYAKAKAKYSAASKIKPSEQYPKDQIKLCDTKTISDDLFDKSYRDSIALADQLFNEKDYAKAKSKYSSASKLKSSEQYPKDQIALCDQKLKELADQNDKAYTDLISMADNLFSAKDWAEAKSDYQQASALKPNEQYPKDRIKICDQQIDAANKPK